MNEKEDEINDTELDGQLSQKAKKNRKKRRSKLKKRKSNLQRAGSVPRRRDETIDTIPSTSHDPNNSRDDLEDDGIQTRAKTLPHRK